jgi:hypothetical protein
VPMGLVGGVMTYDWNDRVRGLLGGRVSHSVTTLESTDALRDVVRVILTILAVEN